MSAAVLTLLGIGGGLIAWTSFREGRRTAACRRAMFDGCTALFDDAKTTIAADGFPRMSGRIGAQTLHVSLVPDTLTTKRLPQLWLVMNLPGFRDMTSLVVTARPRGDDFISAATDVRRHIQVPVWLPADCSVRGDDRTAGPFLERLRPLLEAAFADPRLKEIELGPRGARIVYQACEGRRGAHLLLRQARFETMIEPSVVQRCKAILLDIEEAPQRGTYRDAA